VAVILGLKQTIIIILTTIRIVLFLLMEMEHLRMLSSINPSIMQLKPMSSKTSISLQVLRAIAKENLWVYIKQWTVNSNSKPRVKFIIQASKIMILYPLMTVKEYWAWIVNLITINSVTHQVKEKSYLVNKLLKAVRLSPQEVSLKQAWVAAHPKWTT
jgi:ABC-type dipeptide/oligopeptide/nickel transport system ATPase component